MLRVCFVSLLLLWPGAATADPVLATVLGTRLVSDLPGNAHVQDPNLVNPIGITFSQGSPDWVSNAGSGVATLYNTVGQVQSLVVNMRLQEIRPSARRRETSSISPWGREMASRSRTGPIPRRPCSCSRRRRERSSAGVRAWIPLVGSMDQMG